MLFHKNVDDAVGIIASLGYYEVVYSKRCLLILLCSSVLALIAILSNLGDNWNPLNQRT
jgi:hypothetical protein